MPTAMSTLRKTTLSFHDDVTASLATPSRGYRARGAAIGLMATMLFNAPATAGSADPLDTLRCTLAVETAVAGGPQLKASLHNAGTHTLRLLRWGTPFEGAWLAPIVQVTRDGQALDYQGPMVKRRAPQARDHLTLKPGQSLQASLSLSPAWAVDLPGHYRLTANWMWHGQLRDGRRAITTLAPTDARCEPTQFTRP
jgi:hypothetical protein